MKQSVLAFLASCVMLCSPAPAVDASVPGEATAPYPTLTNLTIEWNISGDENLNGVVEVEYRSMNDGWRKAMPLRRISAGDSGKRTTPTFTWQNRHSGSIFDLRPATEYEIRLKLTDPDGGNAETTLRTRTRPVPKAAANGRITDVNAPTFKEAAANAEPGDILVAAPGYYGSFEAARDGAPGQPIVIRGQAKGGIQTTFDAVSMRGRKHLILENVLVNGSVDLLGGEDLTVRRCTVNALYGIIAKRPPGARNCYIADNDIYWKMPWVPDGMGSGSVYGGAANIGEGIEVTGPGNVICHNRVKGYRDCISLMEDRNAGEQVSIDIYNNDIEVGVDDGIEADFCMSNCRVLRNRITNSFMGISSQPSLGGPTWFVRNVLYNIVESPYKLQRGSGGNVILHNTSVKIGDGVRAPNSGNAYLRTVFRNNVWIGGKGGGRFGRYGSGPGLAIYAPGMDASNDLDYNGIGAHETPFSVSVGSQRLNSIEQVRKIWPHMILVDTGIFGKVEFPDPPVPERQPADLRLRSGAAAVDAGMVLPNVNDGYSGAAPDLGAYELGQSLPHYGPRPEGVDEDTEWLDRNRNNVDRK